jgi:iron only hydrogenase large subunit-like protein
MVNNKNNSNLKFPLKGKHLIMLAPSFVVDFPYPQIIGQLKELGFDKIVELTFGAKMINREYHTLLENSNQLSISTVCPGIVETIKEKFPQYNKNLIPVVSPMIAMARVCKKFYPKHKIVFLSPCNFKKSEAKKSRIIDYVIDYKELDEILKKRKIFPKNYEFRFDKFYNDYTKIYPLAGGLSKTTRLKGIVKKNEVKIIDGINKVSKFLQKPDKNIKFLDCNFCLGGCIGGPCIVSQDKINKRRKKVLDYFAVAQREDISESKLGLVENAKGINFRLKSFK